MATSVADLDALVQLVAAATESSAVKAAAPTAATAATASKGAGTTKTTSARVDDVLGPIIKTLYETGDQQAFLDRLAVFVAKKDEEIEKTCNQHYQGFVVSVDQLLSTRQVAHKLKTKVVELNELVQDAGKGLVEKQRALNKLEAIRRNMSLASATLHRCSTVLALAKQVDEQFREHHYFAALKGIDQLEEANRPLASRYEFAAMIQSGLDGMREQVKHAVRRELQDWFVAIRMASRTIGTQAMEHFQRAQAQAAESRSLEVGHPVDPISIPPEDVEFDAEDELLLLQPGQPGSLVPVYQCLHAFDVLGQRTNFEEYYAENRRLQADLTLTPAFHLGDESMTALADHLSEVVGYFVVETIVSSGTQSSYLKSALVDDLWGVAATRMKTVMTKQMQFCTNVAVLNETKKRLLCFLYTMEHFGYQTIKIVEVLLAMASQHISVSVAETGVAFDTIMLADIYEGVSVETPAELERLQQTVPIGHLNVKPSQLPARLPFSRTVPEGLRAVLSFVAAYYDFLVGFPSGYAEFDDLIRVAVDDVLMNHLNRKVVSVIEEGHRLNLSQAVQVLINVAYLEDSIPQLERHLSEARLAHKGVMNKLRAAEAFRTTIVKAKDVVRRLINRKIDDFVDLAEPDWTPATVSNHASTYLEDLLAYLRTLFSSSLVHIPADIRNLFYLSAAEHLAGVLMNQLIAPNAKHYNVNFIENLNSDVVFCLAFVNDMPLPNLSDFFNSLVQDVEEYLNEKVRKTKYADLPREIVVIMLEKLRERSFTLKSSDKDRRRAIDNVVKALSGKVASP